MLFIYMIFKSLSKYNILKSKNIQNTIIIILIAIMLLIIFWMFFLISIKTIRSILSKEGFDTNSPPPTTETINISINDDTPPTNQVDPEAFGKFYLSTESNTGKTNIITMGEEPSTIKMDFDASSNTRLLIYPISMEHTDKHKANIFPPNFTVNISFPDLSKNYITKYTDSSDNAIKNYIETYLSPNGDICGNFINVSLSVPDIQNPIYKDKTTKKDIGYVDNMSANNYRIIVTDNGNTIDGILIDFKPPK